MAMHKGFLAAGSGSGAPRSAKKKAKAARAEARKTGQTAADVFATPGVAASKARQTNSKKYDLNYSRFDSIGAREAKREEREQALRSLPAGLRDRLGDRGAEMALDMAEKMKKNPDLMPSPEELQAQLEATSLGQPGGGAMGKPAAGSKRMSAYKTSQNSARQKTPAESTVSGGIDSARQQLQEQMREMEEEQARLEAQQQQLADLATSGDAEAFARFLLSQGLTESQVTNMMERPGDPAGLELLKQTLDISMGIDQGSDGSDDLAKKLDKVDEMAEKISQLESMDAAKLPEVEEEEEEDVEEFATDGAAALTRAEKQETGGHKKARRKKKSSMTTAERKMQQDIAKMQQQMAQAQKAAKESADTVAKAQAELKKAKTEYEEVNAQVAQAGKEVDEAASAAAKESEARKAQDAVDAAAYEAQIEERKKAYASSLASKSSTSPGVETDGFIASSKFEGMRQGYVFKTGPVGLGYYPCPQEQAKATVDRSPEQQPEDHADSSAAQHRQAPAYKLERVHESGDGARLLRWTVELPLLTGIKDVNLDLTDTAVRLGSGQYADLELELPGVVDPDNAKAKWIKKLKQLRVDMPLANVEH